MNGKQQAAVDEWLGLQQVSDEWQIPVATIYTWQVKGTGPKAYKFGKHLRFKRTDLAAWAEAQMIKAAT